MKRRVPIHRRKRIGFVSVQPLAGRRRVYLDANAFVGLVLSGVETYRKECYGALLGCTRRGATYVQGAQAYQTARRTRRSVAVPERRRRLLGSILQTIPEPNYLGEFHSHVELADAGASTCLSEEDMHGVTDREIQILIALRPKRVRRRWQHNRDGSISGTTGPFHVKMRAFESVERDSGGVVARVAALRCNYAVKKANRIRMREDEERRLSP
jgi:hypothetical protein